MPWNKPISAYKKENSLEKRKADFAKVHERYPDKIPIILEKAAKSDLPDLNKMKYLVRADLTLGQFVGKMIRSKMALTHDKAIFVFVNNTLPPNGACLGLVYNEHKDPEDGFLYIIYSGENTFGNE